MRMQRPIIGLAKRPHHLRNCIDVEHFCTESNTDTDDATIESHNAGNGKTVGTYSIAVKVDLQMGLDTGQQRCLQLSV